MNTILDNIVNNRREEVQSLKKSFPLTEVRNRIDNSLECNSLRKALITNGASGIIAEFKRQSPSKGMINNELSVETVTSGYVKGCASGLSVLTEGKYFGGSSADLSAAREANPHIPILRKDFMIDEYQIYEAKMLRADVILLIAAVLGKSEIAEFTAIAHELGMEVLLELHEESEIEKIDERVDLIGINNRDLRDFSVNIDRSLRLFDKLPEHTVKISESGISSAVMVARLFNKGFRGFLMGENFMKTSNPGEACRDFILKLSL